MNLRRTSGYFLSQMVPRRNKDMILVTDATGAELDKLLGMAHGLTGVYFHYQINGPGTTGTTNR